MVSRGSQAIHIRLWTSNRLQEFALMTYLYWNHTWHRVCTWKVGSSCESGFPSSEWHFVCFQAGPTLFSIDRSVPKLKTLNNDKCLQSNLDAHSKVIIDHSDELDAASARAAAAPSLLLPVQARTSTFSGASTWSTTNRCVTSSLWVSGPSFALRAVHDIDADIALRKSFGRRRVSIHGMVDPQRPSH